MSVQKELCIIGLIALGTALTRFAPFLLFSGRKVPPVMRDLGGMLPCAAMGLLVVYCLKDLSFAAPPYGLPELIAVAATAALYCFRRNVLLSIGGGTALYMLLVRFVFVQ